MSMMICPECSNQVSTQAAACPKCGFPFVEEETVVVTPAPTPVRPPVVVATEPVRERSFPNWVFVPIALALVFVIFGFIWLMSDNKETANENVNIRIRETAAANTRTVAANNIPTTVNPPSTADSTIIVPPSSTSGSSSSYPNSLPPSSSSSSTVPSSTLPPASSTSTVNTAPPLPVDKAKLAVTATLTHSRGNKTPVKKEKLYLLKEDLDTIMTRAKIEPEEGTYSATLGAAIADPARKDLLNKMLAAIKPYIVASITTDANGKAEFTNVKPDSYYLFGVTKTGSSASVWNTNVVINPGDNTISLNGTASDEPSGVADAGDDDLE